jgi:hypothetical protein
VRRKRCRGCNRKCHRDQLIHGPPKERRCGQCQQRAYRADHSDLPLYRACQYDGCGEKTCCLPHGSGTQRRWFCWSECWRIAALERGKVTLNTTSHKVTMAQVTVLAGRHLLQSRLHPKAVDLQAAREN